MTIKRQTRKNGNLRNQEKEDDTVSDPAGEPITTISDLDEAVAGLQQDYAKEIAQGDSVIALMGTLSSLIDPKGINKHLMNQIRQKIMTNNMQDSSDSESETSTSVLPYAAQSLEYTPYDLVIETEKYFTPSDEEYFNTLYKGTRITKNNDQEDDEFYNPMRHRSTIHILNAELRRDLKLSQRSIPIYDMGVTKKLPYQLTWPLFLAEFDSVMTTMGVENDQRLEVLPLKLEGQAKRMYQAFRRKPLPEGRNEEVNPYTLAEVLEHLTKLFSIDKLVKKRKITFLNVKQNGRSMTDFVEDLMKQADMADISDNSLMTMAFMNGIDPVYRKYLLLKEEVSDDFYTLTQECIAYQDVMEIEIISADKPKTATSPPVTTSETGKNKTCGYAACTRKLGHTTKECRTKKQHEKLGITVQVKQEHDSPVKKKDTCERFGKRGHTIQNCWTRSTDNNDVTPIKDTSTNASTKYCAVCKTSTHDTAKCWKLKGNSQPTQPQSSQAQSQNIQMTCYRCHQPGHMARNCPSPAQPHR